MVQNDIPRQTSRKRPEKLQSALRTNLKRRKAAPKPGLHHNYGSRDKMSD